jgi:DNA-binding transcriptional LysR family regulator
VAQKGSIRAAADALNVAPSAISRQIQKLEQELGAPLFERLARGLRLTSAGEILIHHARASADELERARGAVQDLRGTKRGHAALATVESVAGGFLPRLLAEFWTASPSIAVGITVAGSGRVFQTVAEGEADLALAFAVPVMPKLKQLAACDLRIGAVMSPRHPLARAKSLRFADFVGAAVVLSDTSLTMRPSIEAALHKSSVALVPRGVTNSISVMNLLAADALCVAFETRIGIVREEARGELVFVPLAEPHLAPQRLLLCTRADSPLSTAAEALAKAIAAVLGGLGG